MRKHRERRDEDWPASRGKLLILPVAEIHNEALQPTTVVAKGLRRSKDRENRNKKKMEHILGKFGLGGCTNSYNESCIKQPLAGCVFLPPTPVPPSQTLN